MIEQEKSKQKRERASVEARKQNAPAGPQQIVYEGADGGARSVEIRRDQTAGKTYVRFDNGSYEIASRYLDERGQVRNEAELASWLRVQDRRGHLGDDARPIPFHQLQTDKKLEVLMMDRRQLAGRSEDAQFNADQFIRLHADSLPRRPDPLDKRFGPTWWFGGGGESYDQAQKDYQAAVKSLPPGLQQKLEAFEQRQGVIAAGGQSPLQRAEDQRDKMQTSLNYARGFLRAELDAIDTREPFSELWLVRDRARVSADLRRVEQQMQAGGIRTDSTLQSQGYSEAGAYKDGWRRSVTEKLVLVAASAVGGKGGGGGGGRGTGGTPPTAPPANRPLPREVPANNIVSFTRAPVSAPLKVQMPVTAPELVPVGARMQAARTSPGTPGSTMAVAEPLPAPRARTTALLEPPPTTTQGQREMLSRAYQQPSAQKPLAEPATGGPTPPTNPPNNSGRPGRGGDGRGPEPRGSNDTGGYRIGKDWRPDFAYASHPTLEMPDTEDPTKVFNRDLSYRVAEWANANRIQLGNIDPDDLANQLQAGTHADRVRAIHAVAGRLEQLQAGAGKEFSGVLREEFVNRSGLNLGFGEFKTAALDVVARDRMDGDMQAVNRRINREYRPLPAPTDGPPTGTPSNGGSTRAPETRPSNGKVEPTQDSAPPSMQASSTERAAKVYVLDLFGPQHGDGTTGQAELDYHGDRIGALIQRETGAVVVPRPAEDGQGLDQQLRRIRQENHGDLSNVYVNLSVAAPPLANDAGARQKQERAQYIERVNTELTALSDRGAKVFVSAGNDYVNPFSAARGVITVGEAQRGDDQDARRFNRNTDTVADSHLQARVLEDRSVDVNGDGRGDFRLASDDKRRPGDLIDGVGSSFSTPRALISQLREQSQVQPPLQQITLAALQPRLNARRDESAQQFKYAVDNFVLSAAQDAAAQAQQKNLRVALPQVDRAAVQRGLRHDSLVSLVHTTVDAYARLDAEDNGSRAREFVAKLKNDFGYAKGLNFGLDQNLISVTARDDSKVQVRIDAEVNDADHTQHFFARGADSRLYESAQRRIGDEIRDEWRAGVRPAGG